MKKLGQKDKLDKYDKVMIVVEDKNGEIFHEGHRYEQRKLSSEKPESKELMIETAKIKSLVEKYLVLGIQVKKTSEGVKNRVIGIIYDGR